MRIKKTRSQMFYGGCCGVVATVPMTVAMVILHRLLPKRHREPMEPRQITDCMINNLAPEQAISERNRQVAALAAHFGYGAASGAVYPLVRCAMAKVPASGAAYGIVLFWLSYAGWLPALHILPLPSKRPAGRNLMLVASHVVWGVSLETLYSHRTPVVTIHMAPQQVCRLGKKNASAAFPSAQGAPIQVTLS